MSITIRVLLLTCGLMGVAVTAQGKDNEADMTFHGTLITPPPCTINDDNRIEVNFGERVGINKVDGVNYRQMMNYQITCQQAASGSWALTLSLNGSAAGFDSEALLTDKANLGIRVYQNDQPFTPNSTLKIDLTNPPRLEAVPVKKAGSPLIEGAFEAWATLRADYQ
ncbi:fimbrial protein [Serratia fonticola]|uniref:fimbrial protein n=1 Tax=Serratia fonticola TaxID=47917 RepID=UPI0034C5C12E